MDHEALEAELKRVEARARARRKQFEAAHTIELEPATGWRRHQLKAIGIAMLFAVAAPVIYLLPTLSTKPALSKGVLAAGGGDHAPAGLAKGSSGGAGRMAKKEPADDRDPIEKLFAKIQERQFGEPAEVAAGPFLRNFQAQLRMVDGIDLSKLRPRRRGLGWAVVLAALKADDLHWERQKPPDNLEVRCVRGNGNWKIEQLISIRGAGT